MLRYDDDGKPKLSGDDAMELIKTLRSYSQSIMLPRENDKLRREIFKQKNTLFLAAAELERFYIRAGLIQDERISHLKSAKSEGK